MARAKKGERRSTHRRIGSGLLFFILLLALVIGFSWWVSLPEREVPRKIGRPPTIRGAAQLALIIDDGGYNFDVVREIMALGKPVTFSILPRSPYGRRIAGWIHRQGGEVMLHLPMEPKEGNAAPLEAQTIKVGMSKEQIQKILREAFREVPHVQGMNNHMGSKATEDPAVMGIVMEELKKRGLYFIDSYTSAHSVGEPMARKAGVPFGRNHQFIDQVRTVSGIQESIRLAMARAKREGRAIAIGHPLPITAQTIGKMIAEIEREGLEFVFASEVVR